MFYTNIEHCRGQLLYRGYDTAGKAEYKKIDYNPKIYLKSKEETKFKSLFGQYLAEMKFDSMREARDFINSYKDIDGVEIHGNTDFKYSYLSETFPNDVSYDYSLIETYGLDMETTCENGFPDILTANEEITVLTVHIKTKDLYVCFVNNDYGKDYPDMENLNVKFIGCRDEKTLLEKFISFWSAKYPDIITGWNIEGFDIPYLINRINRILGHEYVKKLSPWNIINEKEVVDYNQKKVIYDIYGIAIMDYLALYKKFTYVTRESYKLDYIGNVELGEGKLSYDEYESMHTFYKSDFKKYIAYNIHDVVLISKLENKLKLLELCVSIAYTAKINISDVYSPVKTWDMLIFNHLAKDNIIIPPKVYTGKSFQYAGAYVKEPKAGMYEWIVSLDAASLYPHIIMQWNISPETLIRKDYVTVDKILSKGYNTEDAKEKDQIISSNGCVYDRNTIGILPKMMKLMYDSRVEYKNKMLEVEKQLQKTKTPELENLRSKYYNYQLVTKILLNSAYGAVGNQYFRYFNIDNAEAVTINGQLILQWAEKHFNEFLNKALKTKDVDYVIYGDTDSIYLNLQSLVEKVLPNEKDKTKIVNFIDAFVTEKLQKIVNTSFSELAEYLNASENKITFKREAIVDKGIFTAKKRYMLNVYDNEGVRYKEPKVKIVGLEAVRSSTPEICRTAIADTFKLLLTKEKEDVMNYIDSFRNKFYKSTPEEISFPKSVKGLVKYASSGNIYSGGTPLHTKGSLIYNHYLKKQNLQNKYTLIQEGNKIKYLYLKLPNNIKDKVIAFPTILPKELDLHRSIDYTTQYNKSFLEPINSILDILEWNKEENLLESVFV